MGKPWSYSIFFYPHCSAFQSFLSPSQQKFKSSCSFLSRCKTEFKCHQGKRVFFSREYIFWGQHPIDNWWAYYTLHIGAPSFSGHSLCVLCRVTQSTHTGSSSFSQYSSSGFRCRLQVSSLGRFLFDRLFDCLRKDSHALLSARLEMACPSSNSTLHKGHFLLYLILFCRHSRQKLWLHGSSTGSWKMPWQTGQVRSCRRGKDSSGTSSSILSAMASRARFSLLSLLRKSQTDVYTQKNTHSLGSV